MPKIMIHNAETNKITEREMNDEELARRDLDKVKAQEEAASRNESEAAKAALLQKLGITEEEAKLLLS